MGTHYLNLDYGNKTACKKDMPLMLLYIDNNLNGFAWQHMAPLDTTGTDWEIFNMQAKLYIPSTVNTDYLLYARHYNLLLIRNRSWILTIHKTRVLRKKFLEKLFLTFKKWLEKKYKPRVIMVCVRYILWHLQYTETLVCLLLSMKIWKNYP